VYELMLRVSAGPVCQSCWRKATTNRDDIIIMLFKFKSQDSMNGFRMASEEASFLGMVSGEKQQCFTTIAQIIFFSYVTFGEIHN